MKKLLLLMIALVLSIPIWASEHTVTISRGEVLEQGNVSGVLAYYCVKDGIMMTFTDGLDNENYLVERRNLTFEVRSANYIIKKIVMHCVDNVLEGDPNFYWGPTTISVVNNFTYPGQLGNYYITNNGYDGVWEGQTMALQFTTSTGKPVRFGSVEITYDKLDGDIFELVTSRDQIVDGQTYVLVTQNDNKAMRFKLADDPTFPSIPIVEWVGPEGDVKRKVKVDGNTCMIKMLGAKDSTYSDNTRRVARLSTLNNGYIRVGTGNDQGNLLVTTSLNDYSRGIMYFGTSSNYLCWFKGDNYSNSSHTIRYDNSDHSFKVMDINDPQTRVWLYKLAQSYNITTVCDPGNGGYINLGQGAVEGKSQEGETVQLYVGTNYGYRISQVTVTNDVTGEVTVLEPVTASDAGNDYTFVMPAASVTVRAEFHTPLFLLGTAMGRTSWVPAGPEMTYDPVNECYYIDAYFKGVGGDTHGYFSFASGIDPNVDWKDNTVTDGDWTKATGRLAGESNPTVLTGTDSGKTLQGQYADNAFQVPAGVYHITVNKDKTSMSIEPIPLHLYFDPVSGSAVHTGQVVTISSDLQSIVHGIAGTYGIQEENQQFANSTDNWSTQENDNTAVLNQLGTTWVNATAWIGHIGVKGTAEYSITESEVYWIHYVYMPVGSAGQVSNATMGTYAGNTAHFSVSANEHYQFDSLTIVDAYNNPIDFSVDENGQYTFTMPDCDVTVTCYFTFIPYECNITVDEDPAFGGVVSINGEPIDYDGYDGKAYVGDTITFKVDPAMGFSVQDIKITSRYGYIDYTDNGDGTYTFVMPKDNVTLNVRYQGEGVLFRVVKKTEQIVPGKTYIYVCPSYEKVMARTMSSPLMTSTDIVEWVTPNRHKVKVNGWSAFLTPEYVNDTTCVQENGNPVAAKAFYWKVMREGTYLSMDDSQRVIMVDGIPQDDDASVRFTSYIVPNDNYYDADHNQYISTYPIWSKLNSGQYEMRYYYTFNFTHDVSTKYVMLYKLPETYHVTTACNPGGGGTLEIVSGVTDGNIAFDGDTVTVRPTPALGYALESLTVTIDGSTSTVEVIDNKDGTYSFEMPVGDATVTANYEIGGYTITKVVNPDGAGEFHDLYYPSAIEGKEISFRVAPNEGYVLYRVTMTYETTGEEKELFSSNGEIYLGDDEQYWYSFDMPADNVTITAYFHKGYRVTYVFEPEDAGEAYGYQSIGSGYYEYGGYYAPNEAVHNVVLASPGYILKSLTATIDDTQQPISLVDEGWSDTAGDYNVTTYYSSFTMPEADVTVTAVFEPYTPLKLIENDNYEAVDDGSEVVVSDTLIVVWAAKDYLWARDMAKPNYGVLDLSGNPGDDPGDDPGIDPGDDSADYITVRDYVKDDIKMQKKDWTECNWVILDCSDLYPEITDVTARRKKLDAFVDHKIAGGTIQGVYHKYVTDENLSLRVLLKAHHEIKLTMEPTIVPHESDVITEATLGYPGYLQDPREDKYNQIYNYSYNHYVPTNFYSWNDYFVSLEIYDYERLNGCVFTPGERAYEWLDDQHLRLFFLPPQDQEVAQVWAVYNGSELTDENDPESLIDKFTVYDYCYNPPVTQNVYDMPGSFPVLLGNWIYNRKDPGYTDSSYGRPLNQSGDIDLKMDSAYLFHIAIRRIPIIYDDVRGPRRVDTPLEYRPIDGIDAPNGYIYEVFPLDMDTHKGTTTASREILETVNPASTDVVSIRYYNIMGQESKSPFDGINIEVTRYRDGSMTSRKIFK